MSFATTWVELKGIILVEISQKEKDNYEMVSCISGIQGKQTKQQEKVRLFTTMIPII